MATIQLERLERTYPEGHVAVSGVDLHVADGELLVLVGPSGCGKSTLLRLIAGLDTPTRGRVLIDGLDVTAVPPQARDLAMVFQTYALYPHMTVYENLAYSLRVRRLNPAAIERRIASASAALGLDALLGRRPGQLSGGERQRVALGRAMVREPQAFLLDEPLSNLDPALRASARAEILRLQRSLGATMIYVTHDQEEAMTLGTRVAVMRHGRLEQIAPPLELYDDPANTFVAGFIGAPSMNFLPADAAGVRAPAGAIIGVRPHDVTVGTGPVAATVDVVEHRGHDALVHVTLDDLGGRAALAVVRGAPPTPGMRVRVGWHAGRALVFGPDGARERAAAPPVSPNPRRETPPSGEG